MLSPIRGWLVRSQLSHAASLSANDREDVAGAVNAFVGRMRRLAPFHVRMGLTVLEIVFAGFLLTLGLYASPDSVRGRRVLALFLALPGPAPTLVRFYSALTALAAFEHPTVLRQMGMEFPEGQQRRLSAMRPGPLPVRPA